MDPGADFGLNTPSGPVCICTPGRERIHVKGVVTMNKVTPNLPATTAHVLPTCTLAHQLSIAAMELGYLSSDLLHRRHLGHVCERSAITASPAFVPPHRQAD
jgi:hypothetical protein